MTKPCFYHCNPPILLHVKQNKSTLHLRELLRYVYNLIINNYYNPVKYRASINNGKKVDVIVQLYI